MEQRKVVNVAIGSDYELYIGSLLEKENYSVLYTGFLFGRNDHRIDLVGVKDNAICLVQCKWKSNGHVSEEEAKHFHEGVNRFKNEFEFTGTPNARFYTNQYFDSDSHEYLDNSRIQAIVKKCQRVLKRRRQAKWIMHTNSMCKMKLITFNLRGSST